MRPRALGVGVVRRYRHDAGEAQVAAAGGEVRGEVGRLRRQHAALLRLLADVDLEEHRQHVGSPAPAGSPAGRASSARSIVSTTSNSSSASFALLRCSGPIRCHGSRRADQRPFLDRLLDAVLADRVDAGGDRLGDRGGRLRLARGDDRAPRSACRPARAHAAAIRSRAAATFPAMLIARSRSSRGPSTARAARSPEPGPRSPLFMPSPFGLGSVELLRVHRQVGEPVRLRVGRARHVTDREALERARELLRRQPQALQVRLLDAVRPGHLLDQQLRVGADLDLGRPRPPGRARARPAGRRTRRRCWWRGRGTR